MSDFSGDFFDADYFENGRETGKSWLVNYHWKPQRSYREAFAFIDYLGLDSNSRVLDYGCAKGFLVKALRELEIKADGCDISKYALSFAPEGCWNCDDEKEWEGRKGSYTHIICKDTLEHLSPARLDSLLKRLRSMASVFMCVVPMGDSGTYRIPEYHLDRSHIIAENEQWWMSRFIANDWIIKKHSERVNGLKDNWSHYENGNHVFVLRGNGI